MAALSYRKIGSGNVSKPHAHVWAQDHGYFTTSFRSEMFSWFVSLTSIYIYQLKMHYL